MIKNSFKKGPEELNEIKNQASESMHLFPLLLIASGFFFSFFSFKYNLHGDI